MTNSESHIYSSLIVTTAISGYRDVCMGQTDDRHQTTDDSQTTPLLKVSHLLLQTGHLKTQYGRRSPYRNFLAISSLEAPYPLRMEGLLKTKVCKFELADGYNLHWIVWFTPHFVPLMTMWQKCHWNYYIAISSWTWKISDFG